MTAMATLIDRLLFSCLRRSLVVQNLELECDFGDSAAAAPPQWESYRDQRTAFPSWQIHAPGETALAWKVDPVTPQDLCQAHRGCLSMPVQRSTGDKSSVREVTDSEHTSSSASDSSFDQFTTLIHHC